MDKTLKYTGNGCKHKLEWEVVGYGTLDRWDEPEISLPGCISRRVVDGFRYHPASQHNSRSLSMNNHQIILKRVD